MFRMKQTKYSIACLAFLSFLVACRSPKTDTNAQSATHISSPSVIVYKTRKDYIQQVPVSMNKERTRIVSYPAPTDLIRGDELTLPTPLANGFLLDNRGITPTVAFLTYTYEEYSNLAVAPSIQELMEHIIDKYPLTQMYECGRRAEYKNIVRQLNQIIKDGFPGCKKVTIFPPLQRHA